MTNAYFFFSLRIFIYYSYCAFSISNMFLSEIALRFRLSSIVFTFMVLPSLSYSILVLVPKSSFTLFTRFSFRWASSVIWRLPRELAGADRSSALVFKGVENILLLILGSFWALMRAGLGAERTEPVFVIKSCNPPSTEAFYGSTT